MARSRTARVSEPLLENRLHEVIEVGSQYGRLSTKRAGLWIVRCGNSGREHRFQLAEHRIPAWRMNECSGVSQEHDNTVRIARHDRRLPHASQTGLHFRLAIASFLLGPIEEKRCGERIRTGNPKDDQAQSTSGDRTARGQHDLRDGAARRVSAPVCLVATVCGLGLGRSRRMAGFPPDVPGDTREAPRRQAAPYATRQSAGSGSKSGI